MLSRRHFTLSATALGLTMLGAAGCSRPSERTTEDLSADVGLTDSGLPIVTDELTLTFGGAKSPLAPEYEAMELVQTWKADSGIEITWNNEPDEVWERRRTCCWPAASSPMPSSTPGSPMPRSPSTAPTAP